MKLKVLISVTFNLIYNELCFNSFTYINICHAKNRPSAIHHIVPFYFTSDLVFNMFIRKLLLYSFHLMLDIRMPAFIKSIALLHFNSTALN